ncbi:hypothetical protein PT279_06550 [Bifidobacterium sp. ESL0784]|uniref:hypothetical protein n=1 Tax=Bifidobacterium sp. ESL0784 TaxID=2983231 RepID=UPI0023F973BA|nr:hypothetical protein [Bifidobacterium sp. ESL0784]MDF7641247.1 hypothetical protein [Bifidobacterium sp. ESL0784]
MDSGDAKKVAAALDPVARRYGWKADMDVLNGGVAGVSLSPLGFQVENMFCVYLTEGGFDARYRGRYHDSFLKVDTLDGLRLLFDLVLAKHGDPNETGDPSILAACRQVWPELPSGLYKLKREAMTPWEVPEVVGEFVDSRWWSSGSLRRHAVCLVGGGTGRDGLPVYRLVYVDGGDGYYEYGNIPGRHEVLAPDGAAYGYSVYRHAVSAMAEAAWTLRCAWNRIRALGSEDNPDAEKIVAFFVREKFSSLWSVGL